MYALVIGLCLCRPSLASQLIRPAYRKQRPHSIKHCFGPSCCHCWCCRTLPPNEASHGIKSSLLGFFSAGVTSAIQGFVSENGLAEASRYHESTRPLEGRMKIPQPSATTRHGAKFTG